MHDKLMDIYNKLYEHFGPRHWWPADSSFEMIIGAILTQNVSWRSVITAIENLKQEGILSLEGILSCDCSDLAALVRPARYHNQKAKKLKAFCSVIVEEFGGNLDTFLTQEMGTLREQLLEIYGIGPETADCIILYAAQQPIFVVDAYTRRIFSRLGIFPEKISYQEMQHFFMFHLPKDVELYNEYHAQIDALGNQICLKTKPRCGECPVVCNCSAWGEILQK
jgi:endonuclease-3 related protein